MALCATAWFVIVAPTYSPVVPEEAGYSPRQQLLLLIHQPSNMIRVPLQTFLDDGWRQFYVHGFVGLFGYLDTALPSFCYYFAYGTLLAAGFLLCGEGRIMSNQQIALLCLGFAVTTELILMTFYLAWSKVDAATIDGGQSRYWIPLVAVLTLGAAGLRLSPRVKTGLYYLIILSPLVNLFAIPNTLIARYYLR